MMPLQIPTIELSATPAPDLPATLRMLATTPSAAMDAGVVASAATLNEGLTQDTRLVRSPDLLRKHRARLRAALLAMAEPLDHGGAA